MKMRKMEVVYHVIVIMYEDDDDGDRKNMSETECADVVSALIYVIN